MHHEPATEHGRCKRGRHDRHHQERGEITSPHGTAAFSVLLMQDLAIVPLLALVPIFSDTGALSSAVPLWK